MNKPNIIYFHTHDTGRYVSPYGYRVASENYQRLAESGLTFKRMHSVAPTCSPSRAALLTGQYPHQCGMISLAHMGASLNDVNRHLIHTLRPAGYHTALIGFQHVINWPDHGKLGYDEYHTPERNASGEVVGPQAVDFLEGRKGSSEPFFASIGLTETHRVFPKTIDSSPSRYLRPPAPFPDLEVFRKDMADYAESLGQADRALGMVLDKLEETGLVENTLVICTTDHGLAFPSMKNNLTDHGTGVLFIMSGPGVPRGEVTDALASQIDVFPTLCDSLGIDAPGWLEGTSFLPLLKDPSAVVHDEIFTQSNYHGYEYHPFRCIRDGRYAYIAGFEDTEWTTFPRSDASPSDSVWSHEGWGTRLAPKARLYDTLFDPHEMVNLAGYPDYSAVEDRLARRLREHMEATKDPILGGPIPPPEGAKHE